MPGKSSPGAFVISVPDMSESTRRARPRRARPASKNGKRVVVLFGNELQNGDELPLY